MSAGEGVAVRRRIATELAAAQLARERGNEGMVRVCARRAAGAAVAEWEKGQRTRTTDAIALLRVLQASVETPAEVRVAAGRLVTRVNPDFTPAHPEDPIADARMVIVYCIGPEVAG